MNSLTTTKNHYALLMRLALPIILANAAVPLLGLADTAVIGQMGNTADLGAIALASLIFSFVYWGFGFLRMGTTGFIAQALGAKQIDELHALVYRTVLLGLIIGLGLIVLQSPIAIISTHFLHASPEVNSRVMDYFHLRIWGAPATLITFSLLGTLIGMGWTKQLLWVQLLLNGLNILLNIVFVVFFQLGVQGIALGTVIAEYVALFFALYLVFKQLGIHQPKARYVALRSRIFQRAPLVAIFQVNSDIMIRTLALITGFAWFARQGASFGDQTLAANHILLQFISLSAFFLDGYANVAEMLVGKAYGAKDHKRFQIEVKSTSLLAAMTALCLALLAYIISPYALPLLTQDETVQQLALDYKSYVALYILLSFAAFQLDGICIGLTYTKAMRNSTVIALIVLVALGSWWIPLYGNAGLWSAFIFYVCIRAVVLLSYLPNMHRSFPKTQ